MHTFFFNERLLGAPGEKINVASGPLHGEPLVFFHGVTRMWQDFSPLFHAFAPRRHLMAVDFRGHGSSDSRPGKYRVMDYVDDVVRLVDSLPGQKNILYGHSLGAMAVAVAAGRRPEKVQGIILEDPPFETLGQRLRETPFFSQFSGFKQLLKQGPVPVRDLTCRLAQLEIQVPGGEKKSLGQLRDQVSLRLSARGLSRMDLEVLDPLIEGQWLQGYDIREIASKIECPVLLLQADPSAGGMLVEKEARIFMDAAPECYRIPFPQAGHLLHWTEREAVLRHTLGFIESL